MCIQDKHPLLDIYFCAERRDCVNKIKQILTNQWPALALMLSLINLACTNWYQLLQFHSNKRRNYWQNIPNSLLCFLRILLCFQTP